MDFVTRVATAADVPAMHRVRTRVCENRLSSPERTSDASYLPYVLSLSIWLAESPPGVLGFAALDAVEESVWALLIDAQESCPSALPRAKALPNGSSPQQFWNEDERRE
jgi:hypothetical protein